MRTLTTACPCGGACYAACCARFIDAGALPPDAATLMRSRYSAYVVRNEAYLRATWHASTCPLDAIVSDDEGLHWLGLEVKSSLRIRQPPGQPAHQAENPADADQDSVEFVARYKVAGRAHRLHEVSRFVREGGRWWYVDGRFPAATTNKTR